MAPAAAGSAPAHAAACRGSEEGASGLKGVTQVTSGSSRPGGAHAQLLQQHRTVVKRLDHATKAFVDATLRRAQHKAWCVAHGKRLPPPRLHPIILRVIREWFDLVDDDGSGTLEHHELLAALQAARIPADADNISEMIRLMDANHDGCIGWGEFEAFMREELSAGKHLLSGEYVLPSGMALPFGVMIRQLKRNQMINEITHGGEGRRKWLAFDVNLSADAKAIADAEADIATQKAFSETLHNRELVACMPGDEPVAAAVAAAAAADAPTGAAARSSFAGMQQQQQQCDFHGVRRPSWMPADDAAGAAGAAGAEPSSAAAAGAAAPVVVAGVAVLPGAATSRRSNSISERAAARLWLRPASVPRLSLGGMHASSSGSSSRSPRSSSRLGAVALLQASAGGSARQRQPCIVAADGSALPVEPGSVLASARPSYRAMAAAATADATPGRSSIGAQLYEQQQQEQQQQQRTSSGRSFRQSLADAAGLLPLSMQHMPEPAWPLSGRDRSRGGSSPSAASLHGVSSARTSLAAAAAAVAAKGSADGSSRASGRSGQLQPQPCREQWSVLAASCLSKQHARQCAGTSSCGVRSQPGGTAAALAASKQQQEQQQQEQPCRAASFSCSGGRPYAAANARASARLATPSGSGSVSGAAPAVAVSGAAAAAAAAMSVPGSNLQEVSARFLLSARATPPAALLSGSYVGPVASAVAAAHTPRGSIAAAAAGGDTGADTTTCDKPLLPAGEWPARQPAAKSRGAMVAGSRGGAAAAAAAAGAGPQTPRLLVATNAGEVLLTAQGEVLQARHGSSANQGDAAAAPAAAAAAHDVGGACSQASPHASGRHSLLAQQLVRPHCCYGDSSSGVAARISSSSSRCGNAAAQQQQQQQQQSSAHKGRNSVQKQPHSSSGSSGARGSSCASPHTVATTAAGALPAAAAGRASGCSGGLLKSPRQQASSGPFGGKPAHGSPRSSSLAGQAAASLSLPSPRLAYSGLSSPGKLF